MTDTNQEVRDRLNLAAKMLTKQSLTHEERCFDALSAVNSALAALASAPPSAVADAVGVRSTHFDVDALAQEIRRVDGSHSLGAGALAEALMPFLASIEPTPSPEPKAAEALADMKRRKDAAYEERNKVVAALAKLFPSGICKTDIPGWSDDWHGCVRIDLPTGQVSWHYHDSQAHLFADLPPYQGEWDGHDTPEKYRRLAALSPEPQAAADDEAYELGKRDGYEEAIQRLDELTGGDGEFMSVLGGDPDGRHCPDVPTMQARIVARFEDRQPPEPQASNAGAVEGWTGKKCPHCSGHGMRVVDDGEERSCPGCAGTGDEFAALSPPEPQTGERDGGIDVDQLAQEIRRVDGKHSLGAGALAEALRPWIETRMLADRAAFRAKPEDQAIVGKEAGE